AHDFNNILSIILGYSALALESIPDGNQAISDVKQVVLAGNRAKDLVKQILAFSRQSELVLQPLKLQPVVKECLKLLRASIPTTIKLRQAIEENCGEILGDPTQIHQVIMNLCTNAYHAMRKQGGTIEISLSKVELSLGDLGKKIELDPGIYVRLAISDTGGGIDQTTLGKIFDPYFTTKEKGEGTGLGLAIVHGIVKDLGGAVTVYSELGQGTTFHVYLPEIVPHDIPVENLVTREIQRGDERILVVDDEDEIVKLIKKMLESLGYTVTAFTNSVNAFEAFQKKPNEFDLIITDMTMPKMTGMELSRKVMEIRVDMPVVICTGFSELITDKKAKAIGVKKLVMKPVIKKDMAKVIREVLDKD
ncbi:MAG: response regulator, partial [Candidatus Omnitrophica bacterium]|nr:response regulator [Candidatus Omnitrophota bacterium]